MKSSKELGDLSTLSPKIQEWLRGVVERADREPDWIPMIPLPEGSTMNDTLKVSQWLLGRYHERIRRRRAAEPIQDIPEFVL